jgi:hypothetical protein
VRTERELIFDCGEPQQAQGSTSASTGAGDAVGGGGPMTLTETFEPLLLRRVYGTFPTGVAALAALVGGNPRVLP